MYYFSNKLRECIHFYLFPGLVYYPFLIILQKSKELTLKEVDEKTIIFFPLNYWLHLLT